MGVTDIIFESVFDLEADNFTLEEKDYMLTAYYIDENRMPPSEILEDDEESDSILRESERRLDDLEADSLQERLRKLRLKNVKRKAKDGRDKIKLQKLVHEALRGKDWVEIEREVRKKRS